MIATDSPAVAQPPLADAFRDAEGNVRVEFLGSVHDAIISENRQALLALVGDLHESDMGELLQRLEAEDRPRLVTLLGSEFDFAALTEVDDAVREEILEEVTNEAIAEGVRDLDSDDAVYILEDLDQADQEEVLAKLPAVERLTLERSLEYPQESAGRRMQADIIAVPPFWTVGQIIDFMRETADLPDKFYQIFVVDADHHVIGGVGLDRLLRAQRPTKIETLMEPEEHTVRVDQDQEEVADIFKRYNLVTIPVVDASNRLVGGLTFDDIVDVIEQEADEDMRALGGVKADEEVSDPAFSIARGRLPWLLINMITAFLAAGVIRQFADEIQKMVALAVLAPIVASMGGNAGTQTMTVTVRALATRQIQSKTAWRAVMREMMVGVLNGAALAIAVGGLAALWFRDPQIGLVIGIAMQVVLVAAGLGGVLVPLTLSRYGADPAVASGPFVTTLTDIVGFFTFLGVATLWFHLA